MTGNTEVIVQETSPSSRGSAGRTSVVPKWSR